MGPVRVGRMATLTLMVLALVSGCRVLHHPTSFDPVLYNRYVRMRVLKRTEPDRRVFSDLCCTRTFEEPTQLLHVVDQGFECSFQAPRLSLPEYIRAYFGNP